MAFNLAPGSPKIPQGWQNVATRLQPVVHGDGQFKPRGNGIETFRIADEGVPDKPWIGECYYRQECRYKTD
jgi:hypothetical protein